MANMAEKIWGSCSQTVLDLLKEHEGYDFVITGHSLGAGTAALLNILLYHQNQIDSNSGSNDSHSMEHVLWLDDVGDGNRRRRRSARVQCCVFACPPVFAPMESIPVAAMQSCTNFIHGKDCVPFLSVDSIRHTLACLTKLNAITRRVSWWSRLRRSYLRGWDVNFKVFARSVQRANQVRLEPKEGAPILYIPAAQNWWIRETTLTTETPSSYSSLATSGEGQDDTTSTAAWKTYNVKNCDSKRLTSFGVQMDIKMFYDHFPQRYEYALYSLLHYSDNDTGRKDGERQSPQS